ncbi:MAG: c-type cytochrome [Myxococcota bacterium]
MMFYIIFGLMTGQDLQEVTDKSALEERAITIYAERCSICHGELGAGDGPTAMAMNPKPTDFTQASYWSNRTDSYVIQQIKYGAPEVFMPAFPKIPEKQLEGLLELLKTFQTNNNVPPME